MLSLKKIRRLFQGKSNRFSVVVLHELHAPERLHEILVRERARADRSGDPFSLVAFTPRERETAAEVLEHLAKFLKRRLRLTDEIGWVDDESLGAVLPSTPAAGAWKVADDACRSFPPDVTPPHCVVWCYPSEKKETAGRKEHARRPRGAQRPVRGLETFFVRSTPGWKRLLDVLGATVGLIVLLPLFLLVALVIKLTSPGPVFFRQRRAGLGGEPFVLYKFRSMVPDAELQKHQLLTLNEQDGPAFKIKHDPRITRVGRFLRATSIDELPQLWNVLRGEMSLVGPRPLPCTESAACDRWQRRRLDVVPGLTCTWQVYGRSRVSFAEWMRMDLNYVGRRSLWQDLKLIVKTLPGMMRHEGR